ncbi:hypothetical protein GO755_29630 [Spirosoma sp. HMF4905]|uniref:Uncharacterized protein n=1 Tax=Spirosoma arboris TaxID=2682092 RepID=A0A7K1SKF1_9BACT|nr:hypothetical protein [Spirosoma arboris]MVM34228.1 hypothetical protein [Spirosoma arboris]
MSEQLIEIMSRWLTTGQISDDEKNLLKNQYLIDIGAVGCKTCGNVWSDIKHHFEYKLKLLNLTPVAKSIRKYIILGGFLMLPGESVVYVNEGQDSEDRKVLTDERAEQILIKHPDYKQLIGINPAWQTRQDAIEAGQESDDEEADETETSGSNEEKAGSETDQKLADLQKAHDTLVDENKKLKEDNRVLKGQLTRTTNELTRLKTAPPVTPAAPVTPAVTPDPANVSTVEVSGEPSATPAGEGSPAESKGSPAADAAQQVIDQSQV